MPIELNYADPVIHFLFGVIACALLFIGCNIFIKSVKRIRQAFPKPILKQSKLPWLRVKRNESGAHWMRRREKRAQNIKASSSSPKIIYYEQEKFDNWDGKKLFYNILKSNKK